MLVVDIPVYMRAEANSSQIYYTYSVTGQVYYFDMNVAMTLSPMWGKLLTMYDVYKLNSFKIEWERNTAESFVDFTSTTKIVTVPPIGFNACTSGSSYPTRTFDGETTLKCIYASNAPISRYYKLPVMALTANTGTYGVFSNMWARTTSPNASGNWFMNLGYPYYGSLSQAVSSSSQFAFGNLRVTFYCSFAQPIVIP